MKSCNKGMCGGTSAQCRVEQPELAATGGEAIAVAGEGAAKLLGVNPEPPPNRIVRDAGYSMTDAIGRADHRENTAPQGAREQHGGKLHGVDWREDRPATPHPRNGAVMMQDWTSDGGRVRILTGDCRETLKELPDGSVNCCVTSPPYYGIRDYQVDGQIGLEETPESYVAEMVAVFRDVRRVLRKDGTLWLNLGDSYNGCGCHHGESNLGKSGTNAGCAGAKDRLVCGLKPKDLIGIPWRVAFALQADGWYLRSEIIWAKPNPMPESVTDRPTKSHEQIFLLSKSARYYYDAEAVKEPAVYADGCNGSSFTDNRDIALHPTTSRKPRQSVKRGGFNGKTNTMPGREAFRAITQTRNRRDVWTVATQPYSGAHFATFPPKLIEPCILAGCPSKVCAACGAPWVRVVETDRKEGRERLSCGNMDDNDVIRTTAGLSVPAEYKQKTVRTIGHEPTCACNADDRPGTVLDPFNGAGTSGLVALKLGRKYIGCELNPEYVEMTMKRLGRELAQPLIPGMEP